METLKYKVIKTEQQYDEYCALLHNLVFSNKKKMKAVADEIELLTFLIEKYNEELNDFELLEPIPLLRLLRAYHQMKAFDLAKLLHLSEGLVPNILLSKKVFSKEFIWTRAAHFKV